MQVRIVVEGVRVECPPGFRVEYHRMDAEQYGLLFPGSPYVPTVWAVVMPVRN